MPDLNPAVASSSEASDGARPIETPAPVPISEIQQRSEVDQNNTGGFSVEDNFPTIAILLFAVLALLGFLRILNSTLGTVENTRMYVIIVVVIGTLLVVTNAFTEQQTSAVIGFFGTIAGYLLGRSDLSASKGNND